MLHQFYAMGSDCAVHLCGETAGEVERFSAAAEYEVRRIEARYSRYRDDGELARINKVAAAGGSIDIDAPIARCSPRAERRNVCRGSNRHWMKLQRQVNVLTVSG